MPSCEAWEVERYSALLEKFDGALYWQRETSRIPEVLEGRIYPEPRDPEH